MVSDGLLPCYRPLLYTVNGLAETNFHNNNVQITNSKSVSHLISSLGAVSVAGTTATKFQVP